MFRGGLGCLSTAHHSRSALALELSTGNLSTADLRWRWAVLRWAALALGCAEVCWRWRCAALGEACAGLRWRWTALALAMAALALALGPAALGCAGAGLRCSSLPVCFLDSLGNGHNSSVISGRSASQRSSATVTVQFSSVQ